MDKEWKVRASGPHGAAETGRLTWREAGAEVERLRANRHARNVEIVRA